MINFAETDPVIEIHNFYPMIRLSDMKYPIYLVEVRNDLYPEHQFPPTVPSNLLEPLGYFPVRLTYAPEGDVVTRATDARFDEATGWWYQGWDVRDFTPEEFTQQMKDRKSMFLAECETSYERDMEIGLDVVFEGETLKVKTKPQDIIDFFRVKYHAEKDANAVHRIFTRTRIFKDLTSAQAIALVEAILAVYDEYMRKYEDFITIGLTSTTLKGIPAGKSTFLEE